MRRRPSEPPRELEPLSAVTRSVRNTPVCQSPSCDQLTRAATGRFRGTATRAICCPCQKAKTEGARTFQGVFPAMTSSVRQVEAHARTSQPTSRPASFRTRSGLELGQAVFRAGESCVGLDCPFEHLLGLVFLSELTVHFAEVEEHFGLGDRAGLVELLQE